MSLELLIAGSPNISNIILKEDKADLLTIVMENFTLPLVASWKEESKVKIY